MRTPDHQQQKKFFYVSVEMRIPKDHPLRPVKVMAEEFLKSLDERFSKRYSSIGHPSIAPKRLLKALLLQIIYSVRSERAFIEHIDYNIVPGMPGSIGPSPPPISPLPIYGPGPSPPPCSRSANLR